MENENREMEEFLDSLGQHILRQEAAPGILNPVRLNQLRTSFRILQQLAEGSDMEVTYRLHSPFKGMGSIVIEGEDIICLDCKHLAKALKPASSVDIHPLTNERIRLILTFHGLTTGIK